MDETIRHALELDIQMTHDRFVQAMETRLPKIEPESLERYFAVLSKLVAKLEDEAKTLDAVMKEMMAEAATLLMAEMQFRQNRG
ncbi:MAG: hypothetical protein ACKOCT_00780 [Alphaproteobacteria bacterium]